jgi:hypothetical protein
MSDIRGRCPCSAPIRRTEMALDPLNRTTATKETRSRASATGSCRRSASGSAKSARERDWAGSARGPEPVDFDGRGVVYSANPVRRGLMHSDVVRGSALTSGGPNAPAVVVAAGSARRGAIHEALRALAAAPLGPPGGTARQSPFGAAMSRLGRPVAARSTTGARVTIRGSPVEAQDAREFGGGERERGGAAWMAAEAPLSAPSSGARKGKETLYE